MLSPQLCSLFPFAGPTSCMSFYKLFWVFQKEEEAAALSRRERGYIIKQQPKSCAEHLQHGKGLR